MTGVQTCALPILNQLVIITADLTNGQDVTQEFVYIVQIKDEQNVIRYLNFFKAEVEQAKTFSPGVSWTPNTSGKYIVEIYVWESFVNPEPLTKVHSLELTAS